MQRCCFTVTTEEVVVAASLVEAGVSTVEVAETLPDLNFLHLRNQTNLVEVDFIGVQEKMVPPLHLQRDHHFEVDLVISLEHQNQSYFDFVILVIFEVDHQNRSHC